MALRIHMIPKGTGTDVTDQNDLCIKTISVDGFLDLHNTVKLLNSSAKDYPIIAQLAEAGEVLFPQDKPSSEKTSSMDLICRENSNTGGEYNSQTCSAGPGIYDRQHCAFSVKGDRVIVFSNVTFSNGNACVSEIKRCIKTVGKSFSSTNTTLPDVEQYLKNWVEEGTKGLLTVLKTVIGAGLMLFNLLLDGIVFLNVLYILVYATIDPVGWVLNSFTSFDEKLQGTLITYVQNYISGVFKVLLRIVFVNGMITWLALDVAGISFSVTLGLLSGIISLFGDVFGNLTMVIPGLIDLAFETRDFKESPIK